MKLYLTLNRWLKNVTKSTFAYILILCYLFSASSAAQELGANFNENIDKTSPLLITKTNAAWIRGFVNIPSICLNIASDGSVTGVNEVAIQNLTRLDNMASAKTAIINNSPTKIIFSLKMAFTTKDMGVPTAGTAQMDYVISAIEKVLTRKNFGANIDILAVGNEPMWETPVADADKYETFLNILIDKVDSMRIANNWNYEIYAGALNKASSNANHAILQKVIKIAKQNPKVAGLDMHEHVTLLSEAENDIKYIRNTQQFTKKLMCTEFSLVWLWNAHASDPLGNWGTNNGYSSTTKMYEWLNQLMQKSYSGTPVSPEHFSSYFNSTTWYPKNWFYTFYNIFKKYNFSQITYGIQNLPINTPLTATSDLWTVNFICNGTYLGIDTDNLGNRNPLIFPQYKAITDSLYKVSSGIKHPEEKLPIRISPIPAKSVLNISSPEQSAYKSIDIRCNTGQEVYTHQLTQLPISINLSDNRIKAGTYIITIKDNKNQSYSQKIIIE